MDENQNPQRNDTFTFQRLTPMIIVLNKLGEVPQDRFPEPDEPDEDIYDQYRDENGDFLWDQYRKDQQQDKDEYEAEKWERRKFYG